MLITCVAMLDVSAAQASPIRSTTSTKGRNVDIYISADVETDGPIPGPFSMLSFALVYAGRYDGQHFERPAELERTTFYTELRPISDLLRVTRVAPNGKTVVAYGMVKGESIEKALAPQPPKKEPVAPKKK